MSDCLDVKKAKIIVYNDSEFKKQNIIVECKNETITKQEFKQAVRHA